MNDYMISLYKQIIRENPNLKISCTSFSRLRPFWVVKLSVSARGTCLCLNHENTFLLVRALYGKKVSKHNTPGNLLTSPTCSYNHKKCIQGECRNGKDRSVCFENVDADEPIFYHESGVAKEQRVSIRTKKEIEAVRTVKKHVDTTIGDWKILFLEKFQQYREHVYGMLHQQEVMRDLEKSLTEQDLLSNMDFSQPFECKYSLNYSMYS